MPEDFNRIGIDQAPRGGTSYPILSAATTDKLFEISDGILDLRIGYDPALHQLPLKLTYVAGLGTKVSGETVPANTFKLVVTDNLGVSVADTTALAAPETRTWASDAYKLVQWSDAPMPLVMILNEKNKADRYDVITAADAIVDPRAAVATPTAVKKIEIYNADNVVQASIERGKSLRFKNGYNTTVLHDGPNVSLNSGKRLAHSITIGAEPGSGLGNFNNCDQQSFVRTLKKTTPNETGNISITGSKCLRVEPVIAFGSDSASIANGVLQLFDDCEACCDCDDMEGVYRAMLRLRRRFEAIGGRVNSLMTAYEAARSTIASKLSCDKSSLLRVSAAAIDNCYMSIIVGVCNPSSESINDVVLRVEVSQILADGTTLPVNITTKKAYSWILRNNKPDGLGKITPTTNGYDVQLDCVEGKETKLGALRVYAPVDGMAQICVHASGWNTNNGLPQPTKTCVKAKGTCK